MLPLLLGFLLGGSRVGDALFLSLGMLLVGMLALLLSLLRPTILKALALY